MNFDLDFQCDVSPARESDIQRRILVRASLNLSNFAHTEDDVAEITELLRKRYGYGPGSDEEVVSCITPEFLAEYFDRKRDERNREAFKDELAARVWETVKGMTWYTDSQKVIPEDLAERVEQKRIDEEQVREDLRRKLTGK